MKKITVDELVSLIQEYKKGKRSQNNPEIIWFDKVEGDLLKYSPRGNYEDLAYSLSKQDKEITLNDQTGSPFTDHDQVYDEEKNIVRKITEEERNSFILPYAIKFNDNGQIISNVYLHTSPINYHGKKGLTSFEYSKMVHNNLNIPVLLFFPLKWREKNKENLSGYEEYLCTADLEDQKQRWFERVSKKSDKGIQIVDNYFLDFLKQAPNNLLSRDFDEPEEVVLGVSPGYYKWECISNDMKRLVKELINLQNEGEDKKNLFDSLYSDGNLDFDKLSSFLNSINDANWEEFLKENKTDLKQLKEYQYIIDKGDRLEIFKLLSSGNPLSFPFEATKALLEFHGIFPKES